MKKVVLILISAFCIFSFSSCTSKTDTTLDATGLNTQVAKEWLNDISYETVAYNQYKTDASYYCAYFPTEINESILRLNITDVSSFISDKYNNFEIPYASSLSLTTYQSNFISDLQNNIGNKLAFLPEAQINSKWATSLTIPETFKNYTGTTPIKLYTVYLPVKFEAYYVNKETTKLIIETYIICPIVYGLAFEEEGLKGVSQQIKSLETISFNTENGFLK